MKKPFEKTEDSIAFDVPLKSTQQIFRMGKTEREAFLKKQLKKIPTNEQRQDLLREAVRVSNLPLVRTLLLAGVDPNKTLLPNPPGFDSLLLGASKIAASLKEQQSKSDTFYMAREIAQLLWIFKGILDFSKQCQRSSETIKNIREQLGQQFPGILDLDHPALGFCYAVHSALQIPERKGADWGRTLFAKMLDSLNENRTEVMRFVAEELQRQERKYPGDLRAPISLVSDHFHCDLLREVCRDQRLTQSLSIDTTESAHFDLELRAREAIKRSVLNQIQQYRLQAHAIVSVRGPSPQLF